MSQILILYARYWWLLLIVFLLSYIWIKGNIMGWRDISSRYGKEMYPFSFRIFLGSTLYIKWALRRTYRFSDRQE